MMIRIFKCVTGLLFATVLLVSVGCSSVGGSLTSNSNASSKFTGFLEGSKIDVAPQVGARIVTLAVAEGDMVQAGQKIASLQDDIVQARVSAADANLATAQAQLALVQAGPRQEELRRAEAQVDKASAALTAAARAVSDAEAIRANPQILLIAQLQAQTRAKVAGLQVEAAAQQAAAADQIEQFWRELAQSLKDGVDIPLRTGGTMHFDTPLARQAYVQEEWSKAGNARWQAWVAVKQAQANSTAADAGLKDINDQITHPILLDSKVDQARASKARAAASVQTAQASLQALREGASPAQIQSAQAAVDQARAARGTLDQEVSRYQIAAPQAGRVETVYYRPGEIALPGAPIARLSVDGELTLRVFVPMSTLDRVHVGDSLAVTVEGIEGQVPGTVALINDRAEFSGRQVQTDNERNAQLVGVEISLENSDGQCKPGMPATVSFK